MRLKKPIKAAAARILMSVIFIGTVLAVMHLTPIRVLEGGSIFAQPPASVDVADTSFILYQCQDNYFSKSRCCVYITREQQCAMLCDYPSSPQWELRRCNVDDSEAEWPEDGA